MTIFQFSNETWRPAAAAASGPVTTIWLSWRTVGTKKRQLHVDGRIYPRSKTQPLTDRCRSLVAAGMPRNMIIEARWKDTGTLSMRGLVHELAKLTVIDGERSGPRFGKWREFDRIDGR